MTGFIKNVGTKWKLEIRLDGRCFSNIQEFLRRITMSRGRKLKRSANKKKGSTIWVEGKQDRTTTGDFSNQNPRMFFHGSKECERRV